jgi:glycosyltransferase involved in cell wall biosynthesis
VKWISCQLGAREHYAIPRALGRVNMLDCLVTDAWFPPSSLLAKIYGRESKLSDRFHGELSNARVKEFSSSLIMFETFARARGVSGWKKIIARDRWFQRKVVSALTSDFRLRTSDSPVLLSYSYTALEPFRYAKSRRWKTVLAQIDPGPVEEAIVAEEAARVPELAGEWRPAPAEYWALWREECELAERIVVNSEWSREGLIRGGAPGEKISVIPLAYEVSAAFAEASAAREVGGQKSEVGGVRKYPDRFTHERPLRVLFLGLINLRKGVARLLEAARILRDAPVEFWMVGPVEIANVGASANGGRVKWFGTATRKQAPEFYKRADLLILPTLSDGFAITQLEAQAHGLPVISSKFCGKVVENGLNGVILEEATATCIAAAVRDCVTSPDRLQQLAFASRVHDKFTLHALARDLLHLDQTL